MKNATRCAKPLTALLKKLPPAEPPGFDDGDDPVAVLVQSFLLADATTEKAIVAYRRLRDHIVDFNDLRVTMPHEIAAYIGSRYPRATDRCQRLRACLRDVYLREHQVNLDALRSAGKRDVKKYLESLDNITPYVSARVMLLCFDTHAMPVDDSLRARLIEVGAAAEEATVAEVSTWLARQVKANEGLATHRALQAWVDTTPPEPARRSKSKARSTKKTAAKKKSPRKSSAKKSGKSTE